MTRIGIGKGWLALALMTVPATAAAQEAPPSAVPGYETSSVIGGSAGGGASGVVGVNLAAGDSNVQANSGALAVGDSAAALTDTVQIVGPGAFTLPGRSVTAIRGQAFQDARGWVGINQASGVGNAQSNSVAVAIGGGGQELAANRLAQVVASPQAGDAAQGEGGSSQRTMEIGPEAFEGAEGVIQVNQSAGNLNATSNSFALRMR